MLVVDSRSIPPGDGSRLFKAAQGFIDNLAPDDALAVATLPIGQGIRFATDRQDTARVLADALKRTSNIGTGLEGIAGFGCTGAAASAGCGDQGLPRGVDTGRHAR